MITTTHPSPGRSSRLGVLSALAVSALFVLAACGSDSKSSNSAASPTTSAEPSAASAASSSSGSDAAAAGLANAKANILKYSKPSNVLPQTEQLSSKPPKKKVAFIVCPDPSCVELSKYLGQATSALGWELTNINASATDPGSAFQQALDSGADYIAQTGYDIAQIPNQYDEAKSRGIPIFACYATDIPAGEANGLYSDCLDAVSTKEYGRALADWVVADSNGTANVVIVNLPAFPILVAGADSAKAGFAQDCPGCKVSNLDLTVDDLSSGEVANKVITYLQTHTDVNYIYEVYEGFGAFGVPDAIASSGLADKVKIVGQQGFQIQMQNLISGKEAAWSTLPYPYAMWTLADQMARYSTGDWSVEEERALAMPFYLVTTKEQAQELIDEPYGWPGPAGFEDAFKKLWQLS